MVEWFKMLNPKHRICTVVTRLECSRAFSCWRRFSMWERGLRSLAFRFPCVRQYQSDITDMPLGMNPKLTTAFKLWAWSCQQTFQSCILWTLVILVTVCSTYNFHLHMAVIWRHGFFRHKLCQCSALRSHKHNLLLLQNAMLTSTIARFRAVEIYNLASCCGKVSGIECSSVCTRICFSL